MKKCVSIIAALSLVSSLIFTASAAESVSALESQYSAMRPALIALVVITIAAFAFSVYLTVNLVNASKQSARHGRMKKSYRYLITCAYAVVVIALICTIACGVRYTTLGNSLKGTNDNDSSAGTDNTSGSTSQTQDTAPSTSETTQPTETEETEPPVVENSLGTVGYTDSANPDNWLTMWDIIKDGTVVDSYTRTEPISFGDPNLDSYFSLPGIATFRGNNYRTGASYGTVNIVENTMTAIWTRQISSLAKGSSSGVWTGCGWTGQPLMVQWDDETKQIMNLYEEKKAKEDLVEVIYATLDGHIYFYDLDDGTYTRDPLNVGMTFKGAGALDPRGYPIMYVGSGDSTSGGKTPRMYIINLIDCSIMYEHGNDEPYSKRSWIAFDSSPLVDAETDTLIWPGETGVLYTMKLNTNYDKENGTLSVSPDNIVKTRYYPNTGYTIGFESSSIIVENYIYIADNGGMFFCVDLNTMELAWVQNTKDDTNATPVFEWDEDGRGYLYTGTSMENAEGYVYIYKLDAATGEIVWEVEYDEVYFDYAVSGGILSSPVLGEKGTELEGMIIYSISKCPGAWNGILVALDTETGETIWEKSLNNYAWSSPVAVYGDDGSARLILCDSGGRIQLMDSTGETLGTLSLGYNVEASPAVYNDIMVVGTRGQEVYGIKLS